MSRHLNKIESALVTRLYAQSDRRAKLCEIGEGFNDGELLAACEHLGKLHLISMVDPAKDWDEAVIQLRPNADALAAQCALKPAAIGPTSHRHVVLLFTDVFDSTRLKQAEFLGADAYAALAEKHDTIFREIVGSIPGGTILKDTGDGFMAEFPTAADAVRAALRFQSLLNNDAAFNSGSDTHGFKVRIGVHQGDVSVGGPDISGKAKYVGPAADLASRIQSLALPGQILISRAVCDDARPYVLEPPDSGTGMSRRELIWQTHGYFEFKGFPSSQEVIEVGAEGIAPRMCPLDIEKAKQIGSSQYTPDEHHDRMARASSKPPESASYHSSTTRSLMEQKILNTLFTKQVNKWPNYDSVWTFYISPSSPDYADYFEARTKLIAQGLISFTRDSKQHIYLSMDGFIYCVYHYHEFPADQWWPEEQMDQAKLRLVLSRKLGPPGMTGNIGTDCSSSSSSSSNIATNWQ
jgi:class 3 adenylate cyclase